MQGENLEFLKEICGGYDVQTAILILVLTEEIKTKYTNKINHRNNVKTEFYFADSKSIFSKHSKR